MTNLNNIMGYILVLTYYLITSCDYKPQEKSVQENTNNSINHVIDSLYFDLNNDGEIDRVKVIEDTNSTRVLIVEIKKDNVYKIISSNSEIIGCSSCGYQSGDPFIDLSKETNDFMLHFEYGTISFFYELDSIYVKDLNILKTEETESGIEESHEIYSFKQFGKLNLSELKAGFEFRLQRLGGKNNRLIDSIKVISFKEFEIVFCQFNKEFNLWYSPKLIVNSDTLSISGLSNENGSELSISKSPEGNYFVIDNIIKGYVEDSNGDKTLYENFTCVIVNVKESKVEQSLQSECAGAWNNENKWVSGGDIVFTPIK